MTSISDILFLAVVANLVLLAYVLIRRHTRPLHFSFAFLVATISGWIFCNYLISVTDSVAMLNVVGRLAFCLAAALGAGYMVFTWTFPETCHPRPPLWTRALLIAIAAVMVAIAASPLVQKDVAVSADSKLPIHGTLYWVYVAYMISVFCLGTGNLVVSLKRTSGGRERMQVIYTLLGFIVSFLFSYVAVFAAPLISHDSDVYLLGAVSPLVWAVATSYAIFRYQFMDLGIAVRKVLVHAASATVMIIGVFVAFMLFGMTRDATPGLLALAMAAIVFLYALVAPSLQKRLQYLVDHRLFKGRYDHETALVRFGGKLLRTQGRSNIAALVAREVPIIVRAHGAAVYLAEPGEDAFVCGAYWCRNDACAHADRVPADHPLLRHLFESPQAVRREQLAYGPRARGGLAPELSALIREMQLELLVPLVCHDYVQGFLVVGEKLNDNAFAHDEIQLVESLASQVAFALDNARLYEQVLASSKQYELILGHIQRPVVAVDEELQVTAINLIGAELLQVPADECLGQHAEDLLPGLADLLNRTIRERANVPPVERTVDLPGKSFPAECETTVISDGQDRVIGALLVFQDLTARKRLEEDMRRMDRLVSMGTLAAGVAHEIKNPLVSIQTFAELLPERYTDESFRADFGTVVRNEVARINNLVQDLLEFARPVQGQSGPVNLAALVERAEALLGNDLKNRRIELIKEIHCPDAVVTGNPEQLYQVVLNVLRNAVDAIPDTGGRITIATRRSMIRNGPSGAQAAVQISFSDSGHGIDEDDLPRIFDPFFSRKDRGSGLGLAVCHGILKNHGADIRVQSAPGQGSTFVFTIPAEREQWT